MREAARELGLKPKSSYALRRGFATRAIEGGADVFTVKRIMGHSDLEELAGYVQETPQARARMLAALGETSPLKAVDPRGPERGPDSDNQPLAEAPKGDETNAA
jgi:integrase